MIKKFLKNLKSSQTWTVSRKDGFSMAFIAVLILITNSVPYIGMGMIGEFEKYPYQNIQVAIALVCSITIFIKYLIYKINENQSNKH